MTLPAPLATEIRASFAGHEQPADIAKRLGVTETEVFAVLPPRTKKRHKAARIDGATNWQETIIKNTSLDTCPLRCTLERPHRIAPGLMVCKGCWDWEHSDAPIKEMKG